MHRSRGRSRACDSVTCGRPEAGRRVADSRLLLALRQSFDFTVNATTLLHNIVAPLHFIKIPPSPTHAYAVHPTLNHLESYLEPTAWYMTASLLPIRIRTTKGEYSRVRFA